MAFEKFPSTGHELPTEEMERKRARSRTRPRRTPKGFGLLLDAVLRYGHRTEARNESFTEYVERLCQPEGGRKRKRKRHTAEGLLPISVRQLARMKVREDVPSMPMLEALARRFPQFGQIDPADETLRNETWIPRMSWEAVEAEKQRLAPGSTVSVFMGLLPLRMLDLITVQMAKGIATAVTQKSITYAFVFPRPAKALMENEPEIELEPEACIERLWVRIEAAWLDSNPAARLNDEIRTTIQERMLVFQTKTSEESVYFWSRLPRVWVAYNLLAEDPVFAKDAFSVSVERGEVPYPSIRVSEIGQLPPPLTIRGWSYVPTDLDERFRRMFHRLLAKGMIEHPAKKEQPFRRPQRVPQ